MNVTLANLLPVCFSAAVVLSGCMPQAGMHEVLQISEDGQYRLEGKTVPRPQLLSTLIEEQRRLRTLQVELRPSPRADMEAVRFAVQAIQSAHAGLAFTRG
jgi:biopolymer transport protein ExbD